MRLPPAHSFPRKARQWRAGYPIHGIEIEEDEAVTGGIDRPSRPRVPFHQIFALSRHQA
mgnify:CR=1 FL=1